MKKNKWRQSVTLVMTAIALISLAGAVTAAVDTEPKDLFSDVRYKASLDRFDDPTIIRTRFVSVDFMQLPAGGETGDKMPRSAILELNLFGGVFFRAVPIRIDSGMAGNITWIGRIEGEPMGQAVLVYNLKERVISGNISIPGAFYQVRSAGDGVHAILQLDHSKFGECAEPDAPAFHLPSEHTHHHEVSAPADSAASIDVMVVYNQAARAGSGSTAAINTEIDLAVTETNQGYLNSGITQRLNLVHTAEVDFIETGNIRTDRDYLRDKTDGYMDEVHWLRNAYNADLVVLITEGGGGYCGVAYIMTTVSTAFEDSGFCVVKRSCATGYYSFGHELGHIMSARHDWYADSTDNSPYTYNHGFVNVDDLWRTIMAYNTECSANGVSCTRLDYWSNPDVLYSSDPMGVQEGSANAADNRKTLNNTAYTVANFRQHSLRTISVTSPNGGEVLGMGGRHTMTWNTYGMPGEVELQLSTNNGGSWNTIIASTPNDGAHEWRVPNTPSTQCLVRVRDAAGGSPSDTSNTVFTIESGSTSSITVTSPNGGESLVIGDLHTITWTSTGTVGDVNIQYSIDNGGNWTNISYATADDGTYDWTVPNTPSLQCLVKIEDNAGRNITGISNAVFAIQEPSINVVSPNGGENLLAGGSHTITWTSAAVDGDVMIEYTYDNGNNWYTLVSFTPNDGAWSWTVPVSLSGQCLVRISAVNGGSPSDTSDAVFAIVAPETPVITVTAPNGGENLTAGGSFNLTWTSSAMGEKVRLQYSIDDGGYWNKLASTANDGSYTWTVPEVDSTLCRVRISGYPDGSPADISDAVFTISTPIPPTPPEIAINREHLVFGATTGGTVSGKQTLLIENNGGGTLNWSATVSDGWLTCSPTSGTGSAIVDVSVNPAGLAVGTYSGSLTIADPAAVNTPLQVAITATVYQEGTTTAPFGVFASPTEGSTVSSSVPVTGWALDDIGVKSVKIYRQDGSQNVYIGDAVFVEGARPDVALAYPGYPRNYAAGWGYMMLTNYLPYGDGTYRIHAVATDAEGKKTTLGVKTIIVNNADAVKPFGALDTPGQGGAVSGGNYVNFGWVLTPQPNTIPVDGSTIRVWVDSMELGHPVYNQYREDIATLFPGYNNSNGAVGYFYLDATQYDNGIHSIHWTATDDAGNTDGIGSRYFSIINVGPAGDTADAASALRTKCKLTGETVDRVPLDAFSPVQVKKGFDPDAPLQTVLPDENGVINIQIREMERIEVHLTDHKRVLTQKLPIGGTLDKNSGVFCWIPPHGFYGSYDFTILKEKAGSVYEKQHLRITIASKY